MQSIAEIIEKINSGIPIEQAIPDGSDVDHWRKLVANHNARKSVPKRKRRPRRSSRRTLRTSAKLIPLSFAEKETRKRAKATGEQVRRVNDTEARSVLLTSAGQTRILVMS